MSNPLAALSNIQFNVTNSDLGSIFIQDLKLKHQTEIETLTDKEWGLREKVSALGSKTLEDVNKLPEVVEFLRKSRTLILAYRDMINDGPAVEVDWATAPLLMVTGLMPKEVEEEDFEEDPNIQYFAHATPVITPMGKTHKTHLSLVVMDTRGRYCAVGNLCYCLNPVFRLCLSLPAIPAVTKLNKEIEKVRMQIEELEEFDYEEMEQKLVSQMTRQVLMASPDLRDQLNTIYQSTVLQLGVEK